MINKFNIDHCQECGNEPQKYLIQCRGCHRMLLCEECKPYCSDCLDMKAECSGAI